MKYIEITKEVAESFVKLLEAEDADANENLINELKEKISDWYKS